MSTISIRKYLTDGSGYIRAEVVWDAQTIIGSDTKRFTLPTGEIASLTAVQAQKHLTLNVIPYDIETEPSDSLQLPVRLGQPLPRRFAGCTAPSLYFDLPYVILPLDDTTYGLALQVGLKPI